MQDLKILNSKEKKEIIKLLEKNYGFKEELNYVFLKNKDNKIYLISKDIQKIDLLKLKINSLGLYFGEIKGNEIRLSIEGSQIIGRYAKKNVLKLDKDKIVEWLKGFDIDFETKERCFVIIKNDGDFYGCGKIKENKILNYVPKIRRLPHL